MGESNWKRAVATLALSTSDSGRLRVSAEAWLAPVARPQIWSSDDEIGNVDVFADTWQREEHVAVTA